MNDPRPDAAAAADHLANRLFFRFFQAANTLHTKGTQAVEGLGMTTGKWSVLGALSRPKARGGMSVSELSRYLLVSRQNLAGVLNRLEEDGLVQRVTGTDDRRSRTVRLTPQGQRMWAAMAEPIRRFYDGALQGFSLDDRIAFIHYLNRLQQNMSRL